MGIFRNLHNERSVPICVRPSVPITRVYVRVVEWDSQQGK